MPQIHVIASRNGVETADEGGIGNSDERHPQHCSRARSKTLPHHEEESRADDRPVADHVLEELETREARAQVRCHKSLQRPG